MSHNKVNPVTGELEQIAGSTLTAIYADAPLGVILPYGGDAAPTGWLLAEGQAVSRTEYAALFAVIGTKYGEGDGSTTFNLPDGEAGAALYPVGTAESGIAGSKYIIKVVQTAVPADFQSAIDEVGAKGSYVSLKTLNQEADFKYSDYRFIFICIRVASYVSASDASLIPVDLIKDSAFRGYEVIEYESATNNIVGIVFFSDTSVKLTALNIVGFQNFSDILVYGIK